MIPRRVTQPPFCALPSGSRDRMNEPTHFDLVTIGGGFAGSCTAVLEAGTDASYLMLTVLGGLAEFERDLIRTHERGMRAGESPRYQTRSQVETD
jgi:hypothetical protein